MHIKRNKVPKTWPIPRKGLKYIARATHANNTGIPILFLLREVMKVARTRKEARYMILNGDVKVNNRILKSEVSPVQVFDVISFEKSNEFYRLEIVNKKFKVEQIDAKEADKKIVKISGKKILGKENVQINLEDGMNLIYNKKFSVGDSAILNTKTIKIEKILPLKKGANVEIVGGKHAGEKGSIKEIEELERGKRYIVKLNDKEVGLPFKTILVIE